MPRFAQLMLHWIGLGDHPDPWGGPVGDFFVSDKEATCAYLSRRFPSQEVEILRKALGSTIIAQIKGRRFMISQEYVEELMGERVVRRGNDFIISVGYSALWEREQQGKVIRDDSDCGYWIASDDPLRGYREYFRRIGPDEFAVLTAPVPRDGDGFPIVTPPDEAMLRVARGIPRSL